MADGREFPDAVPGPVNVITGDIMAAAIAVHRELGPGLYERVYQVCLAAELRERGRNVREQVPFRLTYRGRTFDVAFRADLVVDETVVVELKAVQAIHPVHVAQVISYLRLGGFPVGLLVNFNEALVKDGIHRLVRPDLRRRPDSPSPLLPVDIAGPPT